MSRGTGEAPHVSVVIVSFNTRDELLACAASLNGLRLPWELIVVDNASADGSPAALRARVPAARVVENPENVGFSRANNQGLQLARGRYVLVLNSDAEVRPGAVETLAGVLDHRPDVALVGPRTVSPDGTPQLSFGPALGLLAEWRQRRLVRGVRRRRPAALRRVTALTEGAHEPDWVSGACFLARREALLAVGGFDEGFFLYEEDVDLCLRLRRAGWRVAYTPAAEVVHHLGRSMQTAPLRSRIEYQRSHLRYYRKHHGGWQTLLLRLKVAAGALLRLLAACGPGPERREARRHERHVLALAVWSRG